MLFGISIWLYLVLALGTALSFAAYREENAVLTGIVLLVLWAVLELVFKVAIIWAIIDNPMIVIAGFVLYIGVGVLYSTFWRWPQYVRQHAEKALRSFEHHYRRDLEKSPVERDKSWQEFLNSKYSNDVHPANHKQRFSTWILFWPFGMSWSLLSDPLTWICKTLYRTLAGHYAKTAKNILEQKR